MGDTFVQEIATLTLQPAVSNLLIVAPAQTAVNR